MFSFGEVQGQSSLLHKTGTIEINTGFSREKKPAWLIGLKWLGATAMIAVGYGIAMPSLLALRFPIWQAVLITAGMMAVYSVIAFYLRPEPNTDNMGWGGGLMNDPFQTSDNVNRFLFKLSCCLAPGRFTAETVLDTCVFCGLFGGGGGQAPQAAAPAATQAKSAAAAQAPAPPGTFDATRPIAPLDPNRFAQSSANFVAGQIQLDTQRFLNSSILPGDNQAAKV
jgi:hypothetical protein